MSSVPDMSSADHTPDEDFRVDPALVGTRSKPRFSHTEVKVLLLAIKKHRYILLRKFNQGVSADAKKMIWCRITDQINSLGENKREVRQIMKKWADLKFDAKRRMTGPNRKNFRRKHLGPIEKAVHKILTLSPHPDGDSDADLDQDHSFASISLPDSFSLSTTNSHSEAFSCDRTADDTSCESLEYGLDFEEEEDDDHSFLTEPDDFLRSKPTHTYSRQESSSSQPAPDPPRSPEPPQQPQPPQDPVAVCVQQQRQARTLLASVGRSVETLARSLQQLKERQQLFTQESLLLQRQTVDTLRDFSSTALAMLRSTPRPKHHTYSRK